MKHIPLKITVNLEHGFAKLSNMPLDGVLARLHIDRLQEEGKFDGDWEAELPFLKRTAGCYHVSAPVYTPRSVTNQTIFKRFDFGLYLDIGDKEKASDSLNNAPSGRYKAHILNYELINADKIVFFANGDFDYLCALLEDLKFIGKKAALGWGKVSSVEIEEINEDFSLVMDGEAMRHLPDVAPFSDMPAMGRVIMPIAHPYWKYKREASLIGGLDDDIKVKFNTNVMDNPLVINPQWVLAKLFGFTGIDESIKGATKENSRHRCKMCGMIKKEGYIDPKNTLVGAKTNSLYTFRDVSSPFMCGECFFNYKNYANKLQAVKKGDMADLILFPDRFEHKNFLSSSKENELYDLFKSPPKTPFVVMLKELKGNSMLDMGHLIYPTIDPRVIVVHYGQTTHICPRQRTLSCMEDALAIIGQFNNKDHKVSDDVLFNRQKSEMHHQYLSMKLRKNPEFMRAYGDFLANYDESVRFVAKIMFNTYREEQKNKEKKA